VGVFDRVTKEKRIPKCDALLLLVEQIKTLLEHPQTLPEPLSACSWSETTNEPLFDQDALKNSNVFVSVSALTYLTVRVR
jgi:hypothetical protein